MDYKFKFTIITAVYNTGEYLRESIESVINQDFGFKDNVQLIIVDDGSSDNSKEIALEYQKLYPENILVLSKENGGVASARNLGLQYIEGEFVNFLDSDDKFSKNSLSTINDFLQKYDDVDIVAMPLKYFDKKIGDHYLNYKFKKEGIIDLTKDYQYPHSHISSSFIRYEILKNYTFEEGLVNGSDLLFMNEILIDVKKYGVTNSTHYNYRKRQDESSIMDNAKKSKRFFTEKMRLCYNRLIESSKSREGEVQKFIQYLIALDLNAVIASPYFDEIFDSDGEVEEFWQCLGNILNNIDDDIIKKHRYLKKHFKGLYLYLKNKDFNIEVNDSQVFFKSGDYVFDKIHSRRLFMDIIEVTDGFLTVSGFFMSHSYQKSIDIEACVNQSTGQKIYECDKVYYQTTERKDKKFLDIPWLFYNNFDLKIPLSELNESEISFRYVFHENNEDAVMDANVKLLKHCNLSELSNYMIVDSKIVLFKGNSIHITQKSFLSNLKYEFKSIVGILRSGEENSFSSIGIHLLYWILLVFKRNKRIWLFMDRPTVADDNAKHLFEYATQQNDDIEKYFIVDKSSDDYGMMQKISKNVIAWGSLKHKLYYLISEKLISSHVDYVWINPFFKHNRILYSGLATLKLCFLQHGVTVHDVSHWLKKYNHNFYLMVTVSDYERDSMVNDRTNFSKDVVQTLGFPRFDNLEKDESKKQVLFMPTWRRYLESEEEFLHSEYYNSLKSFLNNNDLLEILKENGYTLIFKPHFNLMQFIDLLDVPSEIQISTQDSYQSLFNESSLLITDYSSVFFDFAYLKKPVVYYRGSDEFHYREGYFDYENMGFGDIITTNDDLINKINDYLSSDFEMEDKYKKRVDEFFKFRDKNNSKRVYDWLYEHKG